MKFSQGGFLLFLGFGLISAGFHFGKYKKTFLLRKYKKSFLLKEYKNFFKVGPSPSKKKKDLFASMIALRK